jgi:glucose/arabinose dehydrogenase
MKRVLFSLLAIALTARADDPKLALKPLASNLGAITSIAHASDARLFLTTQRGQVLIWDGTQILPQPFLDLRSLVSCCGERGLLSIAFHPHYAQNGFFFVDYTDVNGNSVVARYSASASDANRADASSGKVILTQLQPYANHNGGELQFGPDGFLYIGFGDGGSQGDPNGNGQSLGTWLAKILRIDVDHGDPYAVPPSNPYAHGGSALPEIWAQGLRNPWRFSFDRQTGDLWIADVGDSSYEEVDFQPAGSAGGENYGWRVMEGAHCYHTNACSQSGLTPPVSEYTHASGCSITGGYVYRGNSFPRMSGIYVFGDYCSGTIWGLSQGRTRVLLSNTKVPVTTFGEDAAGELYIGTDDGRLLRVIDDPGATRRRVVTH